MKDKGEMACVLSFKAGKEFEATTDGTNNTDANLFVYDQAGKQVGKDDSPGPKCSVKLTPDKDGTYKFVIIEWNRAFEDAARSCCQRHCKRESRRDVSG